MGPRGPSVPAAGSSIRSNAGQGSTTYADTSESEVIGSWERKLSRPTAKSHRGSCKSGWNDVPWNPIAFESSERSSSWPRLSACNSESSLDYNGHGSVGAETRDLGKETSRKDLPVGVRDRQPVRELVFEPNQFAGRPDRRFCPILPNPSTDGRAIASKPRVDVSWEVLITDQVILVETPFEAKLMSAMNQERLGKAFGKPIDLLEVYAQPNSRLSEEIRKQGGKSERFTKEHGDLTTFHGQVQLLEMIFRLRPKHVWVAPECFPWCAWNRFNAGKSMMLYEKIQKSRELSKQHLELCSLICKIQVQNRRHFTVENPGTSDMWNQRELEVIIKLTKTVKLDQCRFGLVHPEDSRPLKKHTRLQTTSSQIVHDLDGRYCQKNHDHAQIAGSCKHQGHRMALSRFAAFYPRILARAAAKSILQEKRPSEIPIISEETMQDLFPAETAEPPAKRTRVEAPRDSKRKAETEDPVRTTLTGETWDEAFEWFQKHLPKSGSVDVSVNAWPGHFLAEHCDFEVKQILAGKGMDKYLVGETTHEIRRTICQCRSTKQIYDLGEEHWTCLTNRKQRRHAMPSHIMICLFGSKTSTDQARGSGEHDNPVRFGEEADNSGVEKKPSLADQSESPPDSKALVNREPDWEDCPATMVPAWSPQSSNNSGPKFHSLDSFQKSLIQRMHNNLGHPTAEKLASHLKRLKFSQELIDGASEYLCQSCSERVPPKLHSPGKLKEPKEFNEVISMDGFEWKDSQGKRYYAIHIFDEATHFHLGRRCQRGTEEAERIVNETWLHWAGPPQTIVHDLAGEFVSQQWKNMLQQHGIQSLTSAAPWQRGRIERHGGTVKEMLSRIDNHSPIKTEKDFDYALSQCFQAKNSMSIAKGYSPEQAVLGRAARLPGSVCSDEDTTAHSLGDGEDNQTEAFERRMNIRTEARKAFIDADNSAAIRRAILRQSRGREHDWKCGELCMIWDKRKAPNMLEKGRWVGPCQVVMHETRTIIWVTHLNRLLRVARENMRSVSLREFQSHHGFQQIGETRRLQEMADQLRSQLRERSGMFQFSDMTENEEYEPSIAEPSNEAPVRPSQPEEEPIRRNSIAEPPSLPPGLDVSQIPVDDPNADEELAENLGPNESVQEKGDGENPHESGEDSFVVNACSIEAVDRAAEGIDDKGTLWSDESSEVADAQFCSLELVVPVKTLEKFMRNPCYQAEVMNKAAKKTHTEVQYRNRTEEEKRQFDEAKRKELKCWIETSTVEPLLRNKIHPSRIMTSKWVLTWKEDHQSPGGRKPKARLVIRGFQDPEVGLVSTESPTLSRDGRMMVLQTVSSKHWQIQSFDIKTAFLRGRSDDRELAMQPVPEFQKLLGISKEHVLLLKGNAYGRVDAPLLFYKEFRRCLENEGFVAHPLDNCLFLPRDPSDSTKLDGILGTHVDDAIGGGNSRFNKALQQVQKKLPFGNHESTKFKFTGLTIEQRDDFSIKVGQKDYVHQIEPIDIPKLRRKEQEAPVTEQEQQQLRALCGSLQYAAVHSRPDMMAKVAFLQKRICSAKVKDLIEANKVLQETKETAETSIIVQPIGVHEITFASFGDASFASENQLKPQQGVFIAACTKNLAENKISEISPVAWHSKQISRVVRSTLSAEAYAMSSSLDKLTWLRCMWAVIKDGKFRWQTPEKSLQQEPKALLITDCKSLYDLVNKMATPNCQEWRTTIEVMLIKQQSEHTTECRWISTAIMLADCLTKPMDSSFLRKVLALGKFRIYDDNSSLKENPNRTYSSRWIEAVSN